MTSFWGAACDDFYISNRLYLKLELTPGRETVLHFLDQLRKEFPGMNRMRRREDGAIVLEEDRSEKTSRRWVRIEPTALRFGFFAPPRIDELHQFAASILEKAPFHLTFSELDYDHLEVVYGFDLEYAGNHDQLVAQTLFPDHPFNAFLSAEESHHVIDVQPYMGIALSSTCDLQAYVEVKSRTATYEIRTGSYEQQPLSVFLTIRKYWGYSDTTELVGSYREMIECADDLAASKVVPLLVNPLAQAIASQP
jgi:hypothetical protein